MARTAGSGIRAFAKRCVCEHAAKWIDKLYHCCYNVDEQIFIHKGGWWNAEISGEMSGNS